MAGYFIERPVFAWVIAIIIMMAGALAIMNLPVAQYPQIAPPEIIISANYPGADAKTIQDTVTQVIEQNMNGIDGLLYMSSSSDSSGLAEITLTFDSAVNPDIAQVQVQNKLQLAMSALPQEVRQQGINVRKSTGSFLMVLGMINTNGTMNQQDISDYVGTNIMDPVSRTPGVGSVQLFGEQYSMRIWVDPNKLNDYQLTPVDIINAVKAQNAQVAAGQLGGTPPVKGQQLTASIIVQTRLESASQFGHILLKVNQDGSRVELKDVAKVVLGGSNDVIVRYNDQPASGLGIKLSSGANALKTANAVRATIAKLQPYFPSGLKVVYPFDTSPFVKISIIQVMKTLGEAAILVFLVMYLFLQNLRVTLIPTIAVPVVLLGTFAVLDAFGFSINTLTMFAMVLAIGLLVDDAIVVIENVERIMAEEGLSPKEATHKSMGQIQGALLGITVVLSVVFIPMAFFGGSTGAIYRQFSITIVSAMVLSVLVAMFLTPALCASFLKPVPEGHYNKKGLFGWFNKIFDKSTQHYANSVDHMLRNSGRFLVMYLLIVSSVAVLLVRLPGSFLPEEDQGVLLTMAQLPTGATQERTQKVLDKVTHYYLSKEKSNVNSVLTVNGFGFSGSGQNNGLAFVSLKNWSDRRGEANMAQAIVARAGIALSHIKDAMVFAFNLPAIAELGTASGFDMELLDQANLGHHKLTQARNQLLDLAAKHRDVLTGVRPNGQDDAPMFKLHIDKEKALALGISLSDINTTLSTAWGGRYISDFVDRGRVKKVYVMADAPYRMLPGDIGKWFVRSASGKMVPFTAFTTAHWEFGSPRLERYNGYPSMDIIGQAAAGKSSGEAMAMMEKLAAKLPQGIGYDWTGMSWQERLSGHQAPALYAISLIIVFLCLAALYESWSVPFSVILVVPLGVLGALLATTCRGMTNGIYFQVSLLTTIGLSAKNAILIVAFAKELMEKENKALADAVREAVSIRLRPILMTSLAFILGVFPLTVSSGAGSGAQNAVGTGVMGGMVMATILVIFFVPVFFARTRRNVSPTQSDVKKTGSHE